MNLDDIQKLLTWLGISGFTLFILVIGLFLVMYIYQPLRVMLSDLFRLIGWLGKFIRRNCLKHEIEGSLNSITKILNKEVSDGFMPICDLKWVTPRNQKAVLESGKAVVCVSFDKRDHDKNFYNVVYSFIQAGLLPDTKRFLKMTTRDALELLMTKLVLKDIRRSVLRIFNDNFVKVEEDCKDVYHRLEESEDKGLFRSLLLQELGFFGEAVRDKTPSDEIISEADRLLDWFYKLVIREKREWSNLAFRDRHIKVGVILVADEEVYDEYGLDAYIRRAYRYASDGYPCVYLISRGARKSKIAHEICHKLVSLEHFEQLNKKTNFVRYDDGHEYVVTCICLKAMHHTIIFDAWDRLEKSNVNNQTIKGMVHFVDIEKIVVDIFGLAIEISLEDLSSMEIVDATKYFYENDILELNVSEVDRGNEYVRLSNSGTETDPKRLVDDALSERRVNCMIEKVISSREGYEIGLFVFNEEKGIRGFIHRKMATYSRFIPLSDKYNVGQEMTVDLVSFDPERKNYKCKVTGLEDPWSKIPSGQICEGQVVSATVRSITSNYITCEVFEGVEGRLPVTEVSWSSLDENREKIRGFEIGQEIEVRIIKIDWQWRELKLSIKRMESNPLESYFSANKGNIVEIKVTRILDKSGALLSLRDKKNTIKAFLPINEISWLYCGDVESKLKVDQNIKVKIIGFSEEHENIIVSRKKCTQNDFERLAKDIRVGDIVEGCVLGYHGDKLLEVEISLKSYKGVGFINFSQITSVFFVAQQSWDKFLVPGETYYFEVQRVIESAKVFSLSRRAIFRNEIDQIEYEKTYDVQIVPIENEAYVYSNFLEGKLIDEPTNIASLPKNAKVFAASIREKEGWIEAIIAD